MPVSLFEICFCKAEVPDAGGSRSTLSRLLRIAVSVCIPILILTGCQSTASREDPPPTSPAAPEPSLDEPAPAAEPALSTAIEYLEAGQPDQAREMLKVLAEAAPGSGLLASLLRQIDAPVEELLPGPYREVEVSAGESLSVIAARELGDPLRFYSLARLNNIEVPGRIAAGMILKVPDLAGDDSAEALDRPTSAEVTASEIESVAEYLHRSGQSDQARRMLVGRIRSDDTSASARSMLIELTLEQAAKLRAADEFEREIAVIDETLSVIHDPALQPALIEARARAQSSVLVRAAERLRDQGEILQAHEVALQAADRDPSSLRAAALSDDIRGDLIEVLHNEALVAWRDRNVDLAIRSWESLLDAVPDFEPAKVYLERARQVRERLDQP